MSCSSSPAANRRRLIWIRCAVLASSGLLMLPGALGHSATVVEFAHLPSGLAAWQRHSLGIYRVCAPFSKFVYALPAHLAGFRVDYPKSFDSNVQSRVEWELGQIFQDQNKERYHDIYRRSRLLPILITILGGYLVCRWSTRLFGDWPGIVSLCAWCWMPPILAHGSLVTSDLLSAVILVMAASCFWAFLLKPNLVTTVQAGLTLGMAVAAKLTLLSLYPCWATLLIGRALQLQATVSVEGRERPPSPIRLAALGIVGLMISVLVIDTFYLFHEVGSCLAGSQFGLSSLAGNLHGLGAWRATAWLLQVPLPIPLELLRGLDFQVADTERLQSAYLFGQNRLGGWWYWYLMASLIKVPLPSLLLFALALVGLPRAMRSSDTIFWAGLCIVVTAAEVALVIATTTGTGTNAAFRYLLPSLGLLCVWAGRAWNTSSRVIRSVILGFLAWLALNAIVSLPDHLGWQNELGWAWRWWSGRPALIGDSLDWGQDLARLGAWIESHSDEGSTRVCAYGFGDGDPYGVTAPSALPTSSPWETSTFLAVSANILFGYAENSSVRVAGGHSLLGEDRRDELLRQQSYDHVGRTIRVYRIRDLRQDLVPSKILRDRRTVR